MRQWLAVAYGFALLGLVTLTGCPAAMPTKPEVSPGPGQGAGPAVKEGAVRERAAREPQREARAGGPTALEALRRGEAPVTPAESPLKEIYFDFDRYDIRADARETLRANAEWLRRNPQARVVIEGHADERGTNEYNLALGAKRAQAAKDYLIQLGIEAGRLSTISYGEEVPVCREKTEECWQRNRRDRFVIAPPKPGA